MSGSSFHGEYRFPGILNKLIQNFFRIIIFPVLETGKRTNSDNITIGSHHRNSFQQMFTLVTIHHNTTFCFQFPGSLVNIKYNDIHSQITGSLLCAKTSTQTVVEENQQTSLMLAK